MPLYFQLGIDFGFGLVRIGHGFVCGFGCHADESYRIDYLTGVS
jgi:hypothetical protein